MSAPRAAGLFDRAIVQSPVGPGALRPLKTMAGSAAPAVSPPQASAGATSLADAASAPNPFDPGTPRRLAPAAHFLVPAEEVGRAFARQLGAPESGDVLAALRAADADAVLAASALPADLSLEVAGMVFGPVIDGVVVPGHPVDRIREGRQHRKPLVVGTTTNEATLFLPGLNPPVDTPKAYRRLVEDRFGPEAGKVLALLPGGTPDPWNDLDRLVTARWFAAYAVFLARQWAGAGLPCWLYRFDRALPEGALALLVEEAGLEDMPREKAGVPHSADLFPVFGFTPWYLGFDAADDDFSRILRTYWTGFARTGRPGGAGLPAWPGYDPARPVAMGLGATVAPRSAPDDPLYPLVEACWTTTLY